MSGEVIKTARRLFEILEYFDEVQRPLSLKEVALHFSYPVSSASAALIIWPCVGHRVGSSRSPAILVKFPLVSRNIP